MEELLKKLGVTESVTPENLEDVFKKIESGFYDRFENDSEIKKKNREKALAQVLSETEKNLMKAFGISDLGEYDAQKISKFQRTIELVKSEIEAAKKGTNEDLQNKIIEKSKMLEKLTADLEAAKMEGNNKVKSYIIQTELAKKIAGLAGKVTINPEFIPPILNSYIEKMGGILEIDETNNLQIFKADKTKFLKPNETGFLTTDDILEQALTQANVIKQSDGKGTPPPNANTPTPPKKGQLNDAQIAMMKKLYGESWKPTE